MSVNLAPGPYGTGGQFRNSNNIPLNGGLLYTYASGTTTPQPTFTTAAGNIQNANPIQMSTDGLLPQEVWLTSGIAYTFYVTDSLGNPIYPYAQDNITGINDFSSIPTGTEWIETGLTPAFVNTTSFTLPGNQTGNFAAKRRVRLQETAGTVYGVVTSSSFSSPTTTINVTMDSGGTVDSGLSDVAYGILNSVNPSIPQIIAAGTGVSVTYVAGIPTIAAVSTYPAQGRLTLQSGVPVSVTNQTAKTVVFWTPYNGEVTSLFVSGAWVSVVFAETSVSVPNTTTTPFDIFGFSNAGVFTLEALTWTNDTTRATALTTQNSILVKSGDATRRYLGTGRTGAVAGQCETSTSNAHLWNYYNRVKQQLAVNDATDTWNYTLNAWQQANASALNQVSVVVGFTDSWVVAETQGVASNTGANQASVGVGISSTTVNSAQVFGGTTPTGGGVTRAIYKGFLPLGRSTLVWLERSVAAGTTTWSGDGGLSVIQSGLIAEVER